MSSPSSPPTSPLKSFALATSPFATPSSPLNTYASTISPTAIINPNPMNLASLNASANVNVSIAGSTSMSVNGDHANRNGNGNESVNGGLASPPISTSALASPSLSNTNLNLNPMNNMNIGVSPLVNPRFGNLASIPNTPSSPSSNSPSSTPVSSKPASLISTPPLEIPHTQSNPMAKKIGKVLEIKLDNPQIISALEALSTFYPENNLKARRNLRGDIEKRGLVINKQFLGTFELVNQQLTLISQEISAMSESCGEMQKRLDDARAQTSQLVGQMAKLKKEKEKIVGKKEMAEHFLRRFTLTEDEIEILSSSQEIHPEFFQALAHLRQIHSDCKSLLTTEHQRAGLEIMESMSIYQETAFEKLFRWTQNELKILSRESVDLTHTLHKAMYALKDRAVLFNTCLEEVCAVRRSLIVRLFIDALTKGGVGGTPRPIELHAHDPLRYIGDILAWIHQTVASERELLENLLTPPKSDDSHPNGTIPPNPNLNSNSSLNVNNVNVSSNLNENKLLDMLDRILEGTCRPMKLRIEQILSSQLVPVLSYRLANLIQFYTTTITKLIGKESQLHKTLTEVSQSAFRVFMDALNFQSEKLIRSSQPSTEIYPPVALQEAINQLKEIMGSYDSSLVPIDEREAGFAPVLTVFLNPCMQVCALTSTNMNATQHAIFMVNCLHFIQNALLLYPFTSTRAQSIEKQITSYIEVLGNEQYSYLLIQSGLNNIVKLMKKAQANEESPLSSVKGLEGAAIAEGMKNFERFLYSVNLENGLYRSISSSRLARTVNQKAARKFLQDFQMISDVVFNTKIHRYEFPSSIVARTAEEVETLLGIEREY